MIVKPGTFRLKRSLNNQVARIFANGLDGFWYDPLLPYLYDTSTGVAQVDAAEDPIGLWIDRSKGAGLGPEKVANGTFDAATGWTENYDGANGWRVTGGVAEHVGTLNPYLVSAYAVTVGSPYRLTCTVTGTVKLETLDSGVVTLTAGTNSYWFRPTVSPLRFYANAAGAIDNISVKLLDGNHSIQATAAARLTYRVDAAGRPYAAFLGTDDSLTSATGGGGSAGFFFCCAIKPTGGAGSERYIFSDNGTNTGYIIRIDAGNTLRISAGNGATYTAKSSTATVNVGTGYVLTAWDDGTNLNVQINNGVVETVARPVVAAGTAGFTIGKTNGAASNYLIADVYHMAYAKNTGLTAAQRRSEQLYAASRIGISI